MKSGRQEGSELMASGSAGVLATNSAGVFSAGRLKEGEASRESGSTRKSFFSMRTGGSGGKKDSFTRQNLRDFLVSLSNP